MPNLSFLDLALLCHPILALLPSFTSKPTPKASRRQYLAFSFFVLLALRHYTPATAPPSTQDAELCQTHDAPNPIAHLYPGNATGTLNGTITILPIPLTLARTLIPKQYRILTTAYHHLLPSFPTDMYPAILQAVHDHEVQAFSYLIPDFTRAGIEFPFLDLLNDGTSFKWAPSLLMSAGHSIALQGARDYGTAVFPATFDPPCDAYRRVGETTAFDAVADQGETWVHTSFALASSPLYSLQFFMNVTNQPTFADGKTCDNMVRLFNTSVTRGVEAVRGSVRAKIAPFGEERVWEGVEGIRLDSAFVENNYLPCEGFSGYGES
ncbi:hypothetical protein M3J09_005285 [Ascochyta lentis]